MAELVVDEKSDDLDIVSTGNLYQGPWEKKYWSSSRGKDRHPYPVGYVAHRTCNGNTYKMAILEGLKGPEFVISSTEGESCSGQTPDIAWDGFQKKSCVRIKFWRGKRYSCKIDGAELFGFKNPLVARLLRGLKANASPIAVKSLPSEQFKGTNEHHNTQGSVHSAESCKDPDLELKLVKTEGKDKRSKKRKEVDVKSVIGSGTQHKRERPQDLIHGNHINGKNKGSQMMNNVGLYAPDTFDPALEDEKGDKKESQMLDDVDLCAPDTSDSTIDSTCNPEIEISKESSCCINNKLNASEKSVTESKSKDEMIMGTGSENSYRSDYSDSLGHEITNSMMTLLLPRALPLLKTYSRKKKKNVPEMSQEQRKGTKTNHQCVVEEVDSTAVAPDSFENIQCEPPMEPSQRITEEVGKTNNKMKSNQDVDLVLEKSLLKDGRFIDSYDLGNISPSKKDPELTGVRISSRHIQVVSGTATTVDAKYTNPVTLIPISTHCEKTKTVLNNEQVKDGSHSNNFTKMVHNDKDLQNVFELVGCYVHPTPISMVMLTTKGNEVFICVLSGYLMEKDRTLFLYKTPIKGETKGHPSFIGHTKITSPVSKNTPGDQIMQFTPDGKCLVLLNHINAPYCREAGVNCKFSSCTPDSFEKNAVKVVEVKIGYVHVVCKLKTTGNICCILVCEPSYLIAADESGKVNLWTMNSTWSAATEHSYLPTSDSMPNSVIEMKRVPNFPSLVVGHTAFGDFCLWDLKRKILVSKFSAPGTSFLPFLPINIFTCPKEMKETDKHNWSLETDNHDDVSLVVLVSDIGSGYWSLALLAKNKLILLNSFDPSTTIAGASAGYGIIGTSDGSMYIWELSSGTNLGYLSHCRGATVSCLAADNNSESGVFGVAVDGSQLQVYAKKTRE